MRSNTTSNRVICPRDGWLKRVGFSIATLVVMLLVPTASMAVNPFTYNFKKSGDVILYGNGTVTNSSGQTVTIISGYDNIAVTGGLGQIDNEMWYCRTGGLYQRHGTDKTLSILNLTQSQKVTITYDGSGNNQNKHYITFRTSNQVQGKNANDNLESGVTYRSCGGSLDLTVPRYIYITEIKVENFNYDNSINFNLNGSSGRVKWDPVQKKMVEANDGLPYFRMRLSSRWFNEPSYTINGGGQMSNGGYWTVENYGPSAPMNYDPKTGKGNKEVAIRAEDSNMSNCDLMFKNPGWCKVTAYCNGYNSSYLVECYDNDALYDIQDNGTKYIFVQNDSLAQLGLSGEQGGILQNRVITAIPGIEVKVGIPEMDEGDAPGADNDNSNYHHQPNTAVVQRWAMNGTDHYICWVNDDIGWWDRYPFNNYSWPKLGSFYTFKATADGKLKVGGIKSVNNTSQNGKVYLVNLDNVGDRIDIVDNSKPTGYYESQEIELKAGQRYCLHGEADNGNPAHWAPFLMEWFSFETDFALTTNYGITQNGGEGNNSNYVTQKMIEGTGSAGWSAVIQGWKGTVSGVGGASIIDGKIQLNGVQFSTNEQNKMGGAVKVRLQKGSGNNYQYFDVVITIPYGKHVWDFRQTAHQDQANSERFKPGDYSYTPEGLVAMMNSNGTDWNRVYKVRHRLDGHWTMLISPILAARSSVYGNNAFYMDNTNGLIFLTGADSFGAEETYNEHGSEYETNHGLKGIDDDEEFGYPYTTVKGADKVWIMGDDASILFPGVKAGQYIKIYTYRHSDDRGQTFKAKNLVDLDNVAYDYNTTFKMNGFGNGSVYPAMVGDNMRGAAIFRVPTDYVATNDPNNIPRLTLCDIGWAQIFRIEIMDEYEPDLLLTVHENYSNGNVPVEYDAVTSSILIRNNVAETRNYLAISGYTGCQNANTCEYELIPDAGVNVDYEHEKWKSGGGVFYNQMNATFNSGNGLVKVIQREKVNSDANSVVPGEEGATVSGRYEAPGYVIDKNIYYIAVGELNAQEYPYTWDFSTYNLYQNESTTKTGMTGSTNEEYGDWNADTENEDGFGQQHFVTVDFKDNNTTPVSEVAEVNKHLFAQGAQLTTGSSNGQSLIAETEGLGVRRPYGADKQFPYLHSVSGAMQVDYRNYKSYDLDENGIAFDGKVLKGVGEITIPDVSKGMYIFVMSDAAPTKVLINNNQVSTLAKYYEDGDIPSGVYVYKNTGNAADVVLNFAKTTGIKKIGVTNKYKKINRIGYASESRDTIIDHTYTGVFTNNDVNAYGVKAYGEGEFTYDYKGYDVVQRTEEVTVVPARTGVVLYKSDTKRETDFRVPLFVPACNVVPTSKDLAILATNWMAPNVRLTEHKAEKVLKSDALGIELSEDENEMCYKFVMTRQGVTYNKTNNSDTNITKTEEVECFYRMRINNSTNNWMTENKAYLLVPEKFMGEALWNGGEGGFKASNLFFLDLENVDFDEGDLDGIVGIVSDDNTNNSVEVYYSIDGTRLNGKPTAKGVYICNGKKVMVK